MGQFDTTSRRRECGKDLVVFDLLRDSKCADCGRALLAHEFLFMEAERPLCLSCADLDHLAGCGKTSDSCELYPVLVTE